MQVIDLPSVVRVGTAVTLTAVMLEEGYAKLHWIPATCWAAESSKERSSVTVPPGAPEPDERDRAVCPQQAPPTRASSTPAQRKEAEPRV